MEVGSERIRQIILSLRSFSRLDESDLKPVDLHEGIDSTLMILQNRLKGNRRHPIQVLKTYTPIPWVECYAGQMNQVFMNLLSNAIDAVEEQSRQMDLTAQPQEWDQGLQESAIVQDSFTLQPPSSGDSEDPTPAHFQPTIWITTQTGEQSVQIHIRDNGIGVSEQVIDQIFNPFFTTKPPGKGTGLGLSISYQIVTEKHHGRLSCVSTVGQGTEFVIELPIQHFDRRALT
jgi:signal transduction histidine kinase